MKQTPFEFHTLRKTVKIVIFWIWISSHQSSINQYSKIQGSLPAGKVPPLATSR